MGWGSPHPGLKRVPAEFLLDFKSEKLPHVLGQGLERLECSPRKINVFQQDGVLSQSRFQSNSEPSNPRLMVIGLPDAPWLGAFEYRSTCSMRNDGPSSPQLTQLCNEGIPSQLNITKNVILNPTVTKWVSSIKCLHLKSSSYEDFPTFRISPFLCGFHTTHIVNCFPIFTLKPGASGLKV